MTTTANVPKAVSRRLDGWSWFWVLPIIALAVASMLWWRASSGGHGGITVLLHDGYGLKTGDEVRYRGIQVGTVDSLELAKSGTDIIAKLVVSDTAVDCMRKGSFFWVARPQLGLGRVSGMDTLVGARYLAVEPGTGERWKDFVALDEPPITDAFEAGGIDVIVQSSQRGSLRPGAPVLFRQIEVGSVISVGLSSDASAVEARLHIREPYTHVLRSGSVFWDAGGIDISAGLLSGLKVNVDSLETLTAGGVGFATPEKNMGKPVLNGHRFALEPQAEKHWLEWKPNLAPDAAFSRRGTLPRPMPAVTRWAKDTMFRWGRQERAGWVLLTELGLLAPADIGTVPADAKAGSVVIEIAGQAFTLGDPIWNANGLALLGVSEMNEPRWPADRTRVSDTAEELLLIGDPALPPLAIAASRLTPREGGWTIDPSLSLERSKWHGAAAVAASDYALVGIVVVEDGQGRVVQAVRRE
jgi:paraquat-inducible protein B